MCEERNVGELETPSSDQVESIINELVETLINIKVITILDVISEPLYGSFHLSVQLVLGHLFST